MHSTVPYGGCGVAGMRVSPSLLFPRTHIPRDACFPAHISLTHLVLQVIVKCVSPGILFPHLRDFSLQRYCPLGCAKLQNVYL